MSGLWWIALAGVIWIAAYFQPFDDTDAPPSRSGVSLVTDALTGCQYLKAPLFGSITPRMSADGKQICKKGQS